MRSCFEPSSSIMVTVASIGESRVWRSFVWPVDSSSSRIWRVRTANGDWDAVVVIGRSLIICYDAGS